MKKRPLLLVLGAALLAFVLLILGKRVADLLTAPPVASGPSHGTSHASVVDGDAGRLGEAEKDIRVLDAHAGAGEAGAQAAAAQTGGYFDEARGVPRFRVAGEVFDALSGKPVSAFSLEVMPTGRVIENPRRHTVTGAADGGFVIDGLSLGTWQVTVRADGYAPSRQGVTLSAVTDDPYLVVPLTAGTKLTGNVVDWRGQPVEGALVGLGNCVPACATTKSDAKGAFVVKSTPEDTPFTLVATHPRYGSATLPDLRVAEGESEHVTVTLSGILKASGHVYRGVERTPAAGVLVKSGEAHTMTNETGAYELFMPLEGNPTVRVVTGTPPVEHESYPESRGAETIRWVSATTHVAELTKDFFLAMETGRLVGRISEADGSPVAGARVLLNNTMGWARRDHETFPAETTTDTEGRYRVDDLPAHAGYRLRLARDNDEQVLGTVALDEPREVVANFVLAANVLHGRFVDAKSHDAFPMLQPMCDGVGATRVGEEAYYPLKCAGDGTFDVERLPAGRYRVASIGSRPHATRVEPTETDVPRRDVIDVPVEGDRSNVWRARITDASGSFVRGPVLRYVMAGANGGQTTITSTIMVGDDGTGSFTVNATQKDIFIEAPGYVTATVQLSSRDPGDLLDVRLTRATGP